jgi:ArsR family transcriptional regulator
MLAVCQTGRHYRSACAGYDGPESLSLRVVKPEQTDFRELMGSGMTEETRMLALSAIAHRSRLAIFRTLVAAGPDGLSAGDISAQLGVVPSSLSFHLKDMLRANLVSGRRKGTFIYYSATLDAIREVIDFLAESCLAGSATIPPHS